jgi:hypothetical protein
MSWRVVLVAAVLTIVAAIAWTLWLTEFGGGDPNRGLESESRMEAADRGERLSGRSPGAEAILPPTEGVASVSPGEQLQRPEAALPESAPPALIAARRALKDPSPEVRTSAVRELVRREDQDAVRALARLARSDPSPEVRVAAEQGLRELGAEDAIPEADEGPPAPDQTPEDGGDPQGPAEIDYDSLSTGELVGLLSDPDADVRESAVDALVFNEHYGAIPALWNAYYSEPSWFGRDLILDALEDMDQNVDEARDLLYFEDETEADMEAIRAARGAGGRTRPAPEARPLSDVPRSRPRSAP